MAAEGPYRYEGSELLRLGEQLPNYNRSIARLVASEISPGAKALDFGAGFGTLTRVVAEFAEKPDCVEPDDRQREVLKTTGFTSFASTESLADESYDVVFSSNVLEHIEDDVAALREFRRVLRPGGKVVLYLPAFQSLYSKIDAAIGHYRRYDRQMISERLERAGFIVREARYADPIGFVVAWIYKCVSNEIATVNTRTIRLYDTAIFPLSRAIERFFRLSFGKNVIAIAIRDEASRTP